MREFKFRHFDERLNDFLFFELLSVGIGQTNDINSFDKDRANIPLQQFTGLIDNQGVGVYDGDYIEYKDFISHVFWSDNDFGFVTYNKILNEYTGLSFFTGYKDFRVIGNIYENPDLLEQE